MRKIILLNVVFMSAICFGQIKEHNCPEGSRFTKQKIGKETVCMCLVGDTLNGTTFIYSKNGSKLEENNWVMGVKTGKWRTWNQKGILTYEGNYSNGKLDGVETFYFDNGKSRTLTTYKDGIKEGRVAEWFASGKQNTEGYFLNNRQDGIWIFRMPDNKTVSIARYKNGVQQTYKFVSWDKDDFSLEELEKKLD